MSVDGTGAIAAGNADLAALVDAELAQLAADAQALRGLLVEDAVVTARVLPSNGLTDLIEIAGRRVAASLPPTVRPGDVLQVQVTGFDGDRILMQIVGTGGDVAVESGPAPPPVAPDPAVFVQASIQPAPPSAGPGAAPRTAPPAAGAAGSLPPAAVPSRPAVGAAFSSVVTRANVASSGPAAPSAPAAGAPPAPGAAPAGAVSSPAQPRALAETPGGAPVPSRPIAMPGDTTPIEARLDASRASPPAPPASGAPPAAGAASRFVAPPAIAPKAAGAPTAAHAIAPPIAPKIPASPGAPARAASPATYAEPAALLRALRLPVTASNVASATLALQRPESLPAALAALEAALPRGTDDANVATLRTLLAFVGRIDPRSPVLATQVEAFVDHVVAGAEPKMATLVAAHASAAQGQPVAGAVAAERAAALSVDLKSTLLAVAADPNTPSSLAPSLAGAITALTAAQVSAAQTLAANPNGLAFSLPLATASGTVNAQIAITRDAPERGASSRADAPNFRIAFVLETAHYGTVAIDLVTVGRDVTVDVRTESAPAMRAFRDALGALVDRLESLRYRVASAGASVGTTSTVAVDGPPAAAPDPTAAVDRSA